MSRHFGVLIPSTNTTVEIEFTRLLPEALQFHTARLGKGGDTPFSPSLDADVFYQSKLLSTSKVEVISLIQTSASLFEEGYDARIKADLGSRGRTRRHLRRGSRSGLKRSWHQTYRLSFTLFRRGDQPC